jgi:ankyrin repeat protein
MRRKTQGIDPDSDRPIDDAEMVRAHGLLEYIACHVLDHLDAEEADGIAQDSHIHRLSKSDSMLLQILKLLCCKSFGPPYQASLLYVAAETGLINVTRKLLAIGYNVNQASWTPNRYPLLTALCGPCAWVSFNSRKYYSRQGSQLEMIRLLLENGADITLSNSIRQKALHIACGAWATAEIVELILAVDPNVDARDQDGETALHRACLSSETEAIISRLLKYGANIDAKDNNGNTPLHRATLRSAQYAAAIALIKGGASIVAQNKQLNTPLHLALLEGRVDLVKHLIPDGLLENGTQIANSRGDTPSSLIREFFPERDAFTFELRVHTSTESHK